ncbi:ABC transporter permease [Conexibacter stalactiti]|uniref:ABC transporter permease n=1 Tax=Conexibacter stalactiti TaxID=1940611 RepID=A0ABU4HYY8_9ACTN|nr:ABC transporter permease [Conexibacter stalactiti]MDW5598438.1 ABC transporter permease [Conexibacter stalactiti]MEC5039080.1 ABC transporter permease [Conexibacter stalactiti]
MAEPTTGAVAAPAPPAAPAPRASLGERLRRLPRPTLLGVSAGLLLLLVLLLLAAPLVARWDPAEQDPAIAFSGSSWDHWFGTDDLGRDLFARVLYGGRLTLLISGGAVLVAFVLGTTWGFLAALRRGIVDELLMRTADALMAIPQLLFALVCISAFGASTLNLALVIGVLLAPTTARMARSVALQEMSRDYYAAAVAYGARRRRLLLAELLPNAVPLLAVQAAINAAGAMILEASLSFVGLGIQPPDASWGTLLKEGYQFLYQRWEYAIFPALAILLTIWLLNVVADQLGARSNRGRR